MWNSQNDKDDKKTNQNQTKPMKSQNQFAGNQSSEKWK